MRKTRIKKLESQREGGRETSTFCQVRVMEVLSMHDTNRAKLMGITTGEKNMSADR